MATLRLFEGVAWDGINVFPVVDAGFDAKVSSATTYEKPVDFIRIGDPILVDLTHAQALKYGYGCLDVDSVRYYLTITSIDVVKANAVYLSYTVDWFTTLRYSESISFGRCHLTHSSDVNPLFYEQNIQPTDMRISNIYPLDEKDVEYEGILPWSDYNKEPMIHPHIVMSYMKDGGLRFYYSPLNTEKTVNDNTYNSLLLADIIYSHFITKNFFEVMELAPQDVTGIWVSPIRPTIGTASLKTYSLDKGRDGTVLTPPYRKYYYSSGFQTHDGRRRNEWLKINNLNFRSTHMKRYFITDDAGNILYQIPIGRRLTSLAMKTFTGFDTLSVAVYCGFDGEVVDNVSHLTVENSSFTFNAPSLPFVNDVYRNWSTGMKGVEAEERRIQRNKNLTQGIGGSALTGALGATAGPAGAVAGVAGGLGGAILSYGVDTYYESKTAELEDQKYRLMADTFVSGNYMPPVATSTLNIVEVSARLEDMARYDKEIAQYGAKCNLPLSSWTPNEGIYKFSDVEVQGNFPYDIKQNIRSKLLQGVRLIK